jgi:hypothetical protein
MLETWNVSQRFGLDYFVKDIYFVENLFGKKESAHGK